MARRVKCYATGEIGTDKTFVRIDNKWFRDKATYEKWRVNNDYRWKTVDLIAEILGYQKGQVFPTVVHKKLKELEFYGYRCVYETILRQRKTIQWYMENKDFDSDYNRIAYMFAIIKNNINDVYRDMKKLADEKHRRAKKVNALDIADPMEVENAGTVAKNISKWLEDDE